MLIGEKERWGPGQIRQPWTGFDVLSQATIPLGRLAEPTEIGDVCFRV